jgi:cysteine sulfinate desulfinase/cysteine desulfurase-like protein
LGLSETDATSTVRIGFGRFNAREEIVRAALRIAEAACRIRQHDADTAAA